MGSSVVEVGFERPPAAAVVRGYVRADANSSVAAQPDHRGSLAAPTGKPSVITVDDVHRIDLGYFLRPAEETATGHVSSRVSATWSGSMTGLLVLDTGMGEHPAVDARYRPTRRTLPQALADVGVRLDEVTRVVNCHLHFDHCGGNPLLPGRPVYSQAVELDEARSTDRYTLPELVDFDGRPLRGGRRRGRGRTGPVADPDPRAHPRTSGAGRPLCRRDRDPGRAAHDHTAAFTADQLAWRAAGHDPGAATPSFPPWIDRLMRFDPRRVYFAHDNAVWEPPSTSRGQQIGRRSAR
jgi:N-acyl homoserine lactone hydrolase